MMEELRKGLCKTYCESRRKEEAAVDVPNYRI
jgi:hypothetical protein